ncbi:MAG: TrmH family RNA methyltransferase [Candidatus Saccharibacteria bacterium]|nr:TrmH family RNA methyltransferase [Candidatus Saccharibacteria bacterium]
MAVKKYKHDSETSFAQGATLVAELLKTQPKLIRRAFLRPTEKHGEDLDRILADLRRRGIEIIEGAKAFNILGAKDSCLLMAEFSKKSRALDTTVPHIVLVNPSDSGNMGTIMRTAAAFGYQNIAIITPAVDPYEPKTIRASMGALFHLNVTQFANIEDYMSAYGERKLYAFMLDENAKKLEETEADGLYSLVFGNEAAGLPKDFATKTGAQAVFIPQSEMVDSLNLSIAAGVAMHYFSLLG